MPVYILRYRGTSTLAGIYAADNLTLLGCSSTRRPTRATTSTIIGEGFGIEFRTRKDRTVYFTIGGTDENPGAALAKAKHIYMTDELLSALVGHDKLRWRRIF
jgi:hypothetical protein